MSTQPVPAGEPMKLTKAELDSMLTEQVQKAIGPALTDALKPLTDKQTSAMEEMLKVQERIETRTKPDSEKGFAFARHARAMALGKGDPERAKFEVKRAWGEDDPVLKSLDGTIKLKNLSASNAGAAGNIVIPQYSREWIDLLRNQTVVRRIARTMPMPVGSITLRQQTAAGTAYYVGEAANITLSQQAVGLFNMNYKKLAALTVVSNDLLRFAGPEADQFVRDDLLAVARIREDLAFLRGDGTANTPRGILSWTDSSNIFNQTGTSLANYETDLARMIRQLEESNLPVDENNCYWIMAPRSKWGIYKLAPGTDAGARPFDTIVKQGRLMGYQVLTTNQVPTNLSGSNSEMYFVHGPSLLVGDSLNVQVDVFNGGAYHDGSAVVSGISTDETVIRLLSEHDFAMRYDEAASIMQAQTIS